MFSAFKSRMSVSNIYEESVEQATEKILTSPTNTEVLVYTIKNNKEKLFLTEHDKQVSLVSTKDHFHVLTILHQPQLALEIGQMIEYKNKTYLTTNITDVDIYPQSIVEHCNYNLLLKTGKKEEIQIGTNERGVPIFEYIEETYSFPCVLSDKIYSALENSQLPLQEGAIILKIAYHEKLKIKTNDIFDIHGDKVKVTTITKSGIYKRKDGSLYGYLTLRGQRM